MNNDENQKPDEDNIQGSEEEKEKTSFPTITIPFKSGITGTVGYDSASHRINTNFSLNKIPLKLNTYVGYDKILTMDCH